jgi:cell division inhibitor SepF
VIFRKKKTQAIDKVKFILMDKNVDVYKLANQLLKGRPLIINFEDFSAIEANKIITFLSGVTYAIDGEIEAIKKDIFLFATKQDYKDGSLRKFVNEYKE